MPVRKHGPAEAPLAKLRGQFRYHILLHAADCQWLHTTVAQVMDRTKPVDGVTCIIDVDPVAMM